MTADMTDTREQAKHEVRSMQGTASNSPAVPPTVENGQTSVPPAWGAIWGLTLGATALVTAQFLPISLLTPMARDLQITEGVAGQTVTAPAALGLVVSLVIAVVTKGLDRRRLLIGLAILLVASNMLTALAPTLPLLLLGRMLMGVCIGAFWPFAPALVMRLVPAESVSRALSTIFGGVALSGIASAPLASVLGEWIGWRGVFGCAAALSILALIWQWVALPSLPQREPARFGTLINLLKRKDVVIGLGAVILSFAGHNAFFTYVRPYLESVTHVTVTELTLILLTFGIAGFIGTSLSARLLNWNLSLTIALMCLLMSLLAAGLTLFGRLPIVATGLLAIWGFANGIVPVGWNTWLTRTFRDEAESGGSLFVATAQLAIMLGAAVGGMVVDGVGPLGTTVAGGILLVLAAVVVIGGDRLSQSEAARGAVVVSEL